MANKQGLLDDFQSRLGYRFTDISHLRQALTHGSSTKSKTDNNERMEFFGDAILDFIICEILLKELPESSEGDLTEIKGEVVSRKSLAKAAKRLKLREVIILGKGIATRDELPGSVYANVFEALIAAVYYDSDISTVREIFVKLLLPEIENAKQSAQKRNYKSLLQEWVQKNTDSALEYKVVDMQGPEHLRYFTVEVYIGGECCGKGEGRSKKEAEQKAAAIAITSRQP